MYSKQIELDTIKREHNFMMVGDPVPVNQFDNHDLHIEEHKSRIKELKNTNYEDARLTQLELNLLEAHVSLHEEIKQSK